MLENLDVRETAAQEGAVIRFTIPRSEMMQVMRPAICEILDALKEQGIGPVGPMFAYHFAITDSTFDFEVGFPVSRAVAPKGRVKPGRLPALSRVAHATYVGPYEGLPVAWGEFEEWYAGQGHVARPSLWEIYAVGPESGGDSATYRTELFRPLAE